MTLEELHQWQEILMINPTMAMNPLLTSGQQRIPLVPSPFGIPTVDRGLLPSTVAPSNPTQFHVPPQFGSSALPNANMPNMLSSHVQSGTYTLVTIGENLSLDEDIQKWTVNDVHNFISGLPGCSDYAQVFKDHAIDGETLPLLTEEHLRSTMGLKLGPALKIRSQVSQHVENMLSKKNPSLHTHTKQAFDQAAGASPLSGFNSWSHTLDVPCSQDIILEKGIKQDSVSN
ncbi:Sterile alpha motif domain-containing protein 7 [Manis javanica]|nr:Sterile alpha motif domain-containing protein 7 [Manis javanica]